MKVKLYHTDFRDTRSLETEMTLIPRVGEWIDLDDLYSGFCSTNMVEVKAVIYRLGDNCIDLRVIEE